MTAKPENDIRVTRLCPGVSPDEIASDQAKAGQPDRSLAEGVKREIAAGIGHRVAVRLAVGCQIHMRLGKWLAVRTQHLPGYFAVGRQQHNSWKDETVGPVWLIHN